ncbi:chromosome partitioning protein ParA, partial [Microcoleus sp. w1-18aA5]
EQSQTQLHQTQGELEQSQTQLHQTQGELEQSQTQLHQTQGELEQSQTQLHQTQGELEQSQTQLHQTQGELEQSQTQLHQTQGELEQSQTQLHQTQEELETLKFQPLARQADVQTKTQYEFLLWEAWFAYHKGDLKGMAHFLKESFKCTPFSPTETVLNWLESLAHFSSDKGYNFDTNSLINSVEWKELTRRTFIGKSRFLDSR